MRCKMLAVVAAIIVTLTTGCTFFQEKIVYRPDINQGNYLTAAEVSQLHTGMTQQQVVYTLGTPMMQDPFGSSTWYYVFRQYPTHQAVTQQTIILTFDSAGIVTHIDRSDKLPEQKEGSSSWF